MYKNKTVWITGASSGIGEALAKKFAEQGASLILSGRRVEALEQVAALCSNANQTHIVPFDVAQADDIEAAVAKVKSLNLPIDMLINNAGISQRSSALETQMDTYRLLFEVDVFGQIALTKAVLPMMIEQGSGHIAIMASVAGKIGVPFRTGYCAVKHAVMGYFDALRTEVEHQGIQVTTITPGYIRTNISKNAVIGDGTAFGKVDGNIAGGMDVDAAAAVMMRGFERGKKEIPVGEGIEMHVLRLKRFMPNFVFKLMNKQYQKAALNNQVDLK